MKISTTIAVLVTSVVLTACAGSNPSSQIKPTVEAKPVMTETKVMKGEGCHPHSTNSMTKSASHCHPSSSATHSHKYGK